MGKSAVLARLVAVCAVTALAGGALVVAPSNADTRGAPTPSVAAPDSAAPGIRVARVRTGLRIRIGGVSPGGRASVRVTGPNQRSRAVRAGKRYSKVIYRSTTLRVVPGVYLVTSRIVAAIGGTDVPKMETKKLRVRKNKINGFTVRYRFTPGLCSAYVVGATGPGGGKVFYVDMSRPVGSRCFEAAPNTWDGGSDPGIAWCSNTSTSIAGSFGTAIGTGKANTDLMVASGACTSGAANSVRSYTGGRMSWSLPSLDELNALDVSGVGGLTTGYYWSSSQSAAAYAWGQYVGAGGGSINQNSSVPKTYPISVRPVRAF